ncbi:MAG: sigma-54-dependent Fis family transcriptional regulator [Neptuniibacter sp.]
MTNETDLKLPDNSDLLSQISFEPDHGKVWLNEQRMILIHSAVMGLLRKELIDTLGVTRAKAFLMRFGYQSGWMDAELVSKVRPDLSKKDAYFVGPQLHGIKGMVKVEPVELEFDIENKHFYCEMDWFNSYEAEVHLKQFGISEDPICWTLLGYASGYTTFYMGQEIFFKENSCAGCGDAHCHMTGRPVDEWEDHEDIKRMFMPDPVADELFALRNEISELKDTFRSSVEGEDILGDSIGQSKAYKKVCNLIKHASDKKVTVLLQGETGVGKEIFAKALHKNSDRSDNPFVAVNCASIPPELIEAELFGVTKGAYTGATENREGKFERASSGTIFLDEVVELPARAQASLLRALQESELERVGDSKTRKIDVRVIAATNEDLKAAVKAGKFRADLYYRLNVFPIDIPPLRERAEDIPLLINHFIQKFNTLYNKRISGVSDLAMSALSSYEWPGNIRELQNMIERGVILTENNHSIDLETFFPSLEESGLTLNKKTGNRYASISLDMNSQDYKLPKLPYQEILTEGFTLEKLEAVLVEKAMEMTDGNITHAADVLGITRSQMSYKLKKGE